jgi:hypothetical protein
MILVEIALSIAGTGLCMDSSQISSRIDNVIPSRNGDLRCCHLECVDNLEQPFGRLPEFPKATTLTPYCITNLSYANNEQVKTAITSMAGRVVEVAIQFFVESSDWDGGDEGELDASDEETRDEVTNEEDEDAVQLQAALKAYYS